MKKELTYDEKIKKKDEDNKKLLNAINTKIKTVYAMSDNPNKCAVIKDIMRQVCEDFSNYMKSTALFTSQCENELSAVMLSIDK
jgi:hypothetical protein